MEAISEDPSANKRVRKPTTFYQAPPVVSVKEVAITAGDGIVMSDNAYFCKELGKFKSDDDVCKGLHQLLFGTFGKKTEIKKNLRSFSGFSEDQLNDKKSKVLEKKKFWTVSLLKSALGIIGLEKGGDREELVSRLITYLQKPTHTKKVTDENPSNGKRKSTSGKGKGGKKARKEKRAVPPSAYVLFCNEKRPIVRENNPEQPYTEIMKTLGSMWTELSEDAKQVKHFAFAAHNSFKSKLCCTRHKVYFTFIFNSTFVIVSFYSRG
jgi:hypothetical protein